ncbi:MAG TPA: M48 family metallopeptidase [Oscillatoriaceae cyanobacterium]
MQVWQASYYDGLSAERHDVTVHAHALGLTITKADGTRLEWSAAELRQTQGDLPGEPCRLERAGTIGEALVVRDDGFAAELRRVVPGAKVKSVNKLPAWRLAIAAVLVAGFVAAAYFFAVPALADQLVRFVPVSWEEALGDHVVSSMKESDFCHDPRMLGAVREIVDKLIAAGPKTPYHYKVYVFDTEQINAFAAPGGDIVVFTGLLKRTDSPEELAGVLAHELQHVQRRHTTRALIRGASLNLLISAMTGSDTGFGKVVGTAGDLGMLRYSRSDEAEADRRGMELLEAAKIDPHGMVRFFKLLESRGLAGPKNLNFLSDHPDTEARIQVLSRMAAEAHYKPIPLLPGVDWNKIKTGCGRHPRPDDPTD